MVWRLDLVLELGHEDMDLIEKDSDEEPRIKGPWEHQEPKELGVSGVSVKHS